MTFFSLTVRKDKWINEILKVEEVSDVNGLCIGNGVSSHVSLVSPARVVRVVVVTAILQLTTITVDRGQAIPQQEFYCEVPFI